MGYWFFGDGTTSASNKQVTVKQDIWADPNLFISGKTGTDVLAQNFTAPSFLTTFQCEAGNLIQTYSNDINEKFVLYEYEPQYQAADLSKIQVIRLRGLKTGFIYMFTGVTIATKGGLLDVTKPINQRTDEGNALAFTGSAFGEAKAATFSLIIRDAAYNIIDPLTLYPEINFIFPSQPPAFNTAVSLKQQTAILQAINIGYITQQSPPLQIQCLNNSPFPAAQPVQITPVTGQVADATQKPSSTPSVVSQLISNTVGTNASVVDQQKTAAALANKPEAPTPAQKQAQNAQSTAINGG